MSEVGCAACGTPLPAGARFCPSCGTPRTATCDSCGAELPAAARFCAASGAPVTGTPPTAAPAPVAERRVTSVLFGDLVGFTALSESRDPEEVRELLTRYFDSAREIVARYGGMVEKFIGDAVMAVWGVPSAHEDDAERAVRAGLDLTEAVAAFGEDVGAAGLAMRVGVVTGEVAVTLGATNQGMVAGDAVNTAARVQSLATPGTVWVDAQTRSLAEASIDFVDAGAHAVKGKQEPVAVWQATAVRGGRAGERSSDLVQAPLVGRRRELGVLKELFQAVAEEDGRARLVLVSGEAGVGKSRLAWELSNYLDGLRTEVLWHRGRCLAYGDGVAFSALTAAVRSRIGVDAGDPGPEVRARLEQALDTYVPDAARQRLLLPALAGLLGLDAAPVPARDGLFAAWTGWFTALHEATGAPVVWVVDDAHHADDGLLDFVTHLVSAAAVPMLVVLLARPDLLARRPQLAGLRRASVVGLETLSVADTGRLLDQLVENLPDAARAELVQRAEGNPLFAIETVRALHDAGLARTGPTSSPGALRAAADLDRDRLRALGAPTSLQVLVASRLDLLPAAERRVLAAAAVLGQSFTVDALQALVGADPEPALRELVARDFCSHAGEGRYVFVQAVVRTVAYQTQSRRDRRTAHLATADHFAGRTATEAELPAIIAEHLRAALDLTATGDPDAATVRGRLRDWLERSARRAAAIGALVEAARSWEQLLDLADEPAEQVRLQLAVAETQLESGRQRQALERVLPLIETGRAGHMDPSRLAHAVQLAITAHRQLGELADTPALVASYAQPGALDGLAPLVSARLSREIAWHHDFVHDEDAAWRWSELALGYAEDTGDPAEIARTLSNVALAYDFRGHHRVAMRLMQLSAELNREAGALVGLALNLVNLVALQLTSDLPAALEVADETLAACEAAGSRHLLWAAVVNVGIARALAGRWDEMPSAAAHPLLDGDVPVPVDEAQLLFERTLIERARGATIDLDRLDALARSGAEQPSSYNTPYFHQLRALHAAAVGDASGCAAAAVDLLAAARLAYGVEDEFARQWTVAVDLLIEVGDLDTARQLLGSIDDVTEARRPALLSAELPRLRAGIAIAGADRAADPQAPDGVEADLLAAIGALDDFGAEPDRARAQAALGSWLASRGRHAEAAAHLDAARATFTRLRAERWLHELDGDARVAATG